MIPYDEQGFEQAVDSILKPWLRDHVTGGMFESYDGTQIRYYRAEHPDAKAVIVMVHGFCEFFGKFHETAYNFWENGYTVYFIELRGHGGSGRQAADPDVVDVGDFSEYVEDLKCFLDKVVLPETPSLVTLRMFSKKDPAGGSVVSGEDTGKQNLLLYAHSMGGCVGALFLERYPEYFLAAVLSSPFLKMTFGATPSWQVNLLMAASNAPGMKEKLLPGMKGFDPEKPDFEASGSTSPARFNYQFSIRKDPENGGIYTMNAGTWRWGRAAMRATEQARTQAARIRIPVLICQAGRDVYVDNEGQNEAVRKLKHGKLVRFPESEHELYASDPQTMENYYNEVLGFFRRADKL